VLLWSVGAGVIMLTPPGASTGLTDTLDVDVADLESDPVSFVFLEVFVFVGEEESLDCEF
jgi:hypothetical protein